MKVCTDACLFGSLAAKYINQKQAMQVLDIGAGTGLLTLMLAQKHPNAIIDAVEIDEAAAQQATENINASPWKNRIQVIQEDIKTITLPTQYDFILTNPPFFKNSLKSSDSKRNIALHSEALHLNELLTVVKKYLHNIGKCIVLLSLPATSFFEQALAKKGFYIQEKILIKQTPKHAYFRAVILFSKQKMETNFLEIIIQNENKQYTPAFAALLKDYYLNF